MVKRHCAIFRSLWLSSCAATLAVTCSITPAKAGESASIIDLAAGQLPQAIAELSREAGVSIGTPGALPALPTPAVHGRMSVGEALARLLAHSGYVARRVGASAWRIERVSLPAPIAPAPPRRPTPPPPPPSAPPPETVEETPIVVIASKRAAPLEDLPMAVLVVPLNTVSRAQAGNGTAAIAARSEGLATTALGAGRNRLFLRGVADSAFNGESQSTVAVVLDETRLTYSAPDPDIRLVDVDRVEVLKGPQGSLYGTGALGGIYHIVTHPAVLDVNAATVAGEVGSVAHGALSLSGSAMANLVLVRDTAALRLVGYSASEGGWVDTGPRRDSNRTRVLGGRANLGAALGDGWRADLSGLIQLLTARDSSYVYQSGARQRPAQFPEPHDNDVRHIAARLVRSGPGIDVTLSSGLTWHEVGDRFDATIGAGSFGLASPRLLHDERAYRVWDSEARVSGALGGLRWLAGVSHVEARQHNQLSLEAVNGAELGIDDDRRNAIDSALFGDVTVPLAHSIQADIGGRLFRSTLVETRRFGASTFSDERHRTGLTPSLAFSWRPGRHDLIFVRYASAFRQGGSDIAANGQPEVLKGDELGMLEAGWRRSLPGGGRIDLGVFASHWENLQSDVLQPNGLIESENAGLARILGAEATLDLPLAGGWRLGLGANLTDALLTRNMTGIALEDRRLPVVPRYTLRGEIARAFTLGHTDVEARLSLRYVGPQRLSFDPVIDRRMGVYLDNRFELSARLGAMRAFVVTDNPFGGAKDSFAFGNPLRFATMRQYTPQRPASVSIGIMGAF